jgi:hypothetical protein
MNRFLLVCSLFCTTFLAALYLPVSALGIPQVSNPALAGFTQGCENNSKTCWYGILPGVTTIIEANTILINLRFQFEEIERRDRETWMVSYTNEGYHCLAKVYTDAQMSSVDSITLRCDHMQLGDFIPILGNPQTFFLRGWSFEDEKILISMEFISEDKHRCLNTMPTGKIEYFSLGSKSLLIHTDYTDQQEFLWHGFIPYERYVRLYDFPSCEVINMLP